jgi:hypothetical protein
MKRLVHWAPWVPAFVSFGPLFMVMFGAHPREASDWISYVFSLLGAVMLGAGSAITFRLTRDQAREIERLRGQVQQGGQR